MPHTVFHGVYEKGNCNFLKIEWNLVQTILDTPNEYFVITYNRLIFPAHYLKPFVCFHKCGTFLRFLGFLQLSASMTVLLKVKMKGSLWHSCHLLPWLLAQPLQGQGMNPDWSGTEADSVLPGKPLLPVP